MKKSLLFIYFLPFILWGQSTIEVRYDVKTNFNNLYETTAVLLVDQQNSYYIDNGSVIKNKELKKQVNDSGEISYFVPESNNRPKTYVDLSKDLLISSERLFRRNNIIKEKIPKIHWEIKKDTKKIGKFLCQRAKGYFRGRNYNVWFTDQIPLPFGPWKLQGLPGLILEVKDDKNEVYFRVTKLDFKENVIIPKIPNNEKTIFLKEFITEVIPKEFKALESLMNSKNDDRNTTISLSLFNRNTEKEIIYEWEEQKE